MLQSEKGTSLSTLLGRWLSGMLTSVCPGFDFAHYMKNAIEQAADHDRQAIMHCPRNRCFRHKFLHVRMMYDHASSRQGRAGDLSHLRSCSCGCVLSVVKFVHCQRGRDRAGPQKGRAECPIIALVWSENCSELSLLWSVTGRTGDRDGKIFTLA